MQVAQRAPPLSVVIPVLDDTRALRRLLPRLRDVAPGAELIVADGGGATGLARIVHEDATPGGPEHAISRPGAASQPHLEGACASPERELTHSEPPGDGATGGRATSRSTPAPFLELAAIPRRPREPSGLDAVVAAHDATLVRAPRGRGVQMNAGAAVARGEALWFLHADVVPPLGAARAISVALGDAGIVGGAFGFRLRERHAYAPWLDATVNLRSRVFGLPYGDQGVFVRRGAFERLGGFRPLPLMEDVDFVRRLRRLGHMAVLDLPVEISARRWEREGFLRVTLRNQMLLAAHLVGVPAERLAPHYRPVREGTPA